ncbi:MAG TPA: HNH endonuclease, partial [Gammaproteobacteria bacterium]|nr:HNH endonuclease [Gammaproteobacteria bacterium]
LITLHTLPEGYEVNPKSDLCPVCPNCHAMLHRRNPPYTVDELRVLLSKKS